MVRGSKMIFKFMENTECPETLTRFLQQQLNINTLTVLIYLFTRQPLKYLSISLLFNLFFFSLMVFFIHL